eukprot:225357_1
MVALLLLSSYLILYEQVLSRPIPQCLPIIAKQQEYEAHETLELKAELDTILKDCWTDGKLKRDKWKHTSEEVCPNEFVKTDTSKECSRFSRCYWKCSNTKVAKIESCYMSQSITTDLKRKNVGLKHLAIITQKSVSKDYYLATCTGWIIDSTAMITAGHCGFMPQMSARPIGRYRVTHGWIGEKGSEDAAGRDTNAKEPIDIYIDNNWRNINEDHLLAKRSYDYSVWKFPEGSFAGDKLFKIAKYNEDEEHLLFRAGYPGYLEGQGLYFVGDTTKVLDKDIFLKSQCYAGSGESGGPTWYLKTTGSMFSKRTDPICVALATKATREDESEPKITIKHTWSVKINDDILTWLCSVFEFKFLWNKDKRVSIGCPSEDYTSTYVQKNVISFSDARDIGAGESFIGIGDSVDTDLKSSHPVIEYYGALMKRTGTETTVECTVFIVSSQIAITAAECFDRKSMSNWGKTFNYFIMPNWDANIHSASDLNAIDESKGIVISKIQTINPKRFPVAVILLEQELDSFTSEEFEYPFQIVPFGIDMSRARKLFRVGYADKMLGNANHVYLYRDTAMNANYGFPPTYKYMYFPFSYYKSDIGSVIFEYEGESKTAMINSIIIQNKIKKGEKLYSQAKAYMFNKELVEMIGKVMNDKFGLSKTIVSAICGEYGEHTSEIDMSGWKEYLPAKDAHVGYFDYFDNYLYDNDNNDYIDDYVNDILNEIYMEGFKSG